MLFEHIHLSKIYLNKKLWNVSTEISTLFIYAVLQKRKGELGRMYMEKAYDRLNWKFIKSASLILVFLEKWTNWIMECITIARFSMLANRVPSKPFKPERGIR